MYTGTFLLCCANKGCYAYHIKLEHFNLIQENKFCGFSFNRHIFVIQKDEYRNSFNATETSRCVVEKKTTIINILQCRKPDTKN